MKDLENKVGGIPMPKPVEIIEKKRVTKEFVKLYFTGTNDEIREYCIKNNIRRKEVVEKNGKLKIKNNVFDQFHSYQNDVTMVLSYFGMRKGNKYARAISLPLGIDSFSRIFGKNDEFPKAGLIGKAREIFQRYRNRNK